MKEEPMASLGLVMYFLLLVVAVAVVVMVSKID